MHSRGSQPVESSMHLTTVPLPIDLQQRFPTCGIDRGSQPVESSMHLTTAPLPIDLQQRFPSCGMRTPGGTRRTSWGYAESKSAMVDTRKHKGLKRVTEFSFPKFV
ncbi:hypothetical protein AVEN_178090-1 [Araneus ventricosus]|uniref:Uncharacterized protein n=1 Tax=Araneus ventricosus TaxID=182803 RepID=A0A4Y2WPS1_ARAVE|nr:hypothetical protein AVEN_178090-1 [Araneus ventricosus]